MFAEIPDPAAWFLGLLATGFFALLAACLGAFVALFAIHRMDQRERDRQRRDDLRKAAMDFFRTGARAEDSMVRVIGACLRGQAAAEIAEAKMKDEFFNLCTEMEALDTFLELLGEEKLRPSLVEYHKRAMRCEAFVSKSVMSDQRKNRESGHDEIDAVHELRRKSTKEFAAELDRLRQAGRLGIMARLFDRISGL